VYVQCCHVLHITEEVANPRHMCHGVLQVVLYALRLFMLLIA